MSPPKHLLIFGIGKLAQLLYYYLLCDKQRKVAAFTVHKRFILENTFQSLPIMAFESIEDRYGPDDCELLLAIGYRAMRDRQNLFEQIKTKGYGLANYISNRAIVYHDNLELGENNIIMPGVQIEPFVRIGHNNLFWSGCLICHDVTIGNHNYLSARVVIGGESKLEDVCFIGNSCTTINNVTLSRETHILPGSTVYENTQPFTKYIGNPARPIGKHQEQGIIIERG